MSGREVRGGFISGDKDMNTWEVKAELNHFSTAKICLTPSNCPTIEDKASRVGVSFLLSLVRLVVLRKVYQHGSSSESLITTRWPSTATLGLGTAETTCIATSATCLA